MNNKDFSFIDLFAGIGGMRIPFDKLRGTCVFSSEWDKFAQQTYLSNFEETPYGDINSIEIGDIPAHDILLAGFPCQPFSMAGKKKGFEDTRGTLFFNIANILDYHKPQAFLLENVRNLVSHNNGETFNTIITTLKKLGYHVFWEILNSKNYNVPQSRQRVYIVGFLKNVQFQFPKKEKLTNNVHSILDKEADSKYTISDALWHGHQRRKIQNNINNKGFGYGLITKESIITRALTARYYKDGAEILIEQIGKNPRKLTPRECARLQGFSDQFIIPVSDNQAYKQFGNSVSVPIIEKIARNMLFCLNKTNCTSLLEKPYVRV